MEKKGFRQNLMRVIAVLCIVAMLPMTAVMAASATITLASAGSGATAFSTVAAEAPQIAAGAQVEVTGTHSVAGAEVTFLIAPEGATAPIQGIGQRTSASAEGTFTFHVLLPENMEDGIYYVKVGGEDVDEPQVRYFKIGSAEPSVDMAKLTVSITGSGKVTSTGAYVGEITGGATNDYAVGSAFALTAVPGEDNVFIHWIDERSGRVVSTEAEYSFALGTATSLRAVFRQKEEPALVIFKERNSRVVVSQSGSNDVTVPDDPYTIGYEFEKWVKADGTPQTLKAGDKIAAGTYQNDMIFIAQHKKSAQTYTVTLTNAQGAATGDYQYDTKLSVTPAAAPGGQKFAYWKKDGKIVSYEQNYIFYVAAYDTAVEAVFVAEGETVTPVPVLVMTEPFMVQGNKMAFFAERNLPAQYELVESGILLTDKVGTELTLDNAMYKNATISKDNNGQFTVRKAGVTIGETWAGRAYMIYKDGETVKTIYSNTVVKTFQ